MTFIKWWLKRVYSLVGQYWYRYIDLKNVNVWWVIKCFLLRVFRWNVKWVGNHFSKINKVCTLTNCQYGIFFRSEWRTHLVGCQWLWLYNKYSMPNWQRSLFCLNSKRFRKRFDRKNTSGQTCYPNFFKFPWKILNISDTSFPKRHYFSYRQLDQVNWMI